MTEQDCIDLADAVKRVRPDTAAHSTTLYYWNRCVRTTASYLAHITRSTPQKWLDYMKPEGNSDD